MTEPAPHAAAPPARPSSLVAQFGRYLLVGGGAFVVDFGTLALLNKVFGVHYLVAAAAGFVLGSLSNYALSVSWVFSQRRVSRRSVELGVFVAVGIVGLGLNQGVLYGLTGRLGLDPLLSKLVSTGVVLFWNFGARKFLLF